MYSWTIITINNEFFEKFCCFHLLQLQDVNNGILINLSKFAYDLVLFFLYPKLISLHLGHLLGNL